MRGGDGAGFARAAELLGRHRGLLAVLAGQAVVFAVVLGSGSPWTTASLECASGAMGEALLDGDVGWSIWDTFHGALGGMFVSAGSGAPLFLLLGGVGPIGVKLLAWVAAAGLVTLVYGMLDRHESRDAALLAAAGLAFCPPVLFHVATVFGNWHWTQLLFDYGSIFAAVELARAERRPRAWGAFGLLIGLGIFNCMGSLPFLAISVGLLFLSVGGWPGGRRVAAAAAGVAVGAAPFVYKLLLHRPFGLAEPAADQTVGRLQRLSPDLTRLPDLVYPELPWSLHLHDVWPGASLGLTWRIESAWSAIVWVGVLLATAFAVRALRPGPERRVEVGLVPGLFVLAFAAVYVVLDVPLRVLPIEFTNVREPGHRLLPPLIAALVIGSAVGWTRLAERIGLKPLLLGVAALPAVVGLASQVALVAGGAPDGSGVSSYRAVCFDALGHFASGSFREDIEGGLAACADLGAADRERDCRRGFAWGSGFFSSRLQGTTDAGAPALAPSTLEVCDRFDADLRNDCLLGVGWYLGAANWGVGVWPLRTCDSLEAPEDQAACWRGVGFPVGDHMHPTPAKAAGLLGRLPERWRSEAAVGVGVAIGRTYSDPAHADWLCDRIGERDADECRAGVADWFAR